LGMHTYTIITRDGAFDVDAVDRHHAREIAERKGYRFIRIELVRDVEPCVYD
jgi:hypothetical protein